MDVEARVQVVENTQLNILQSLAKGTSAENWAVSTTVDIMEAAKYIDWCICIYIYKYVHISSRADAQVT